MATENKSEDATKDAIVLNPEGEKMIDFPAIAETAYISSNELLSAISSAMKELFIDFEGWKIDSANNSGEVTIIFGFNHGKYTDLGGKVYGVQLPSAQKTENERINAIRNNDHYLTQGDRYYVTEDLAGFLKPYLTRQAFNNGKPNWKNLCSETQFSNGWNQGYRVPQRTEVRGISLRAFCKTLFGIHDENGGDNYDYDVMIKDYPRPNAFGQLSNEYILAVIRCSEDEVKKMYAHSGFVVADNNDLVR